MEMSITKLKDNSCATSDLHIQHTNIMKYEPTARGHFKDLDHMNTVLINEINACGDADIVFGGDMFMGQKILWNSFVSRINNWGNIYAVRGNHDISTEKAGVIYPNGLPDFRYLMFKGIIFYLTHVPPGGDYQDRDLEHIEPTSHYHYRLNGHRHSKGGFSPDGISLNICWDLHKRILHMDEVLDLCRTHLKNDHSEFKLYE